VFVVLIFLLKSLAYHASCTSYCHCKGNSSSKDNYLTYLNKTHFLLLKQSLNNINSQLMSNRLDQNILVEALSLRYLWTSHRKFAAIPVDIVNQLPSFATVYISNSSTV
jgi:hypothetical protein